MKQLRLVFTALAVLVAGYAAIAAACDQSKSTQASAAAVTAINGGAASACPYTAAACAKSRARTTAAAASSGCPHSGASGASFAAASGCSHAGEASASVAASSGCSHANGASAMAAGCPSHAKGVSAAMACADKATASGKSGCNGHGMTTAAALSTHGDCDACSDMATCEAALESASATSQVVALKNGVMYVYTADTPARVHAVQAAMTRRNDHMVQFATAGDRVHLCPFCKEMRGAAASGKLTREFVNIEGGCLTLVTSNDPAVVAKIHAQAGITTASRVKS